jgi:hypothetical protein
MSPPPPMGSRSRRWFASSSPAPRWFLVSSSPTRRRATSPGRCRPRTCYYRTSVFSATTRSCRSALATRRPARTTAGPTPTSRRCCARWRRTRAARRQAWRGRTASHSGGWMRGWRRRFLSSASSGRASLHTSRLDTAKDGPVQCGRSRACSDSRTGTTLCRCGRPSRSACTGSGRRGACRRYPPSIRTGARDRAPDDRLVQSA